MALTPIHRHHQFQPGTVRFEAQVQAHAAAAQLISHHQLGHQRPRLEQLNRFDWLDLQWMLSVIRSDVPGIPELTPIPVAARAQWCHELINPLGIPQLQQPQGRAIQLHQTVADTPDLRRESLDADRMSGRHLPHLRRPPGQGH